MLAQAQALGYAETDPSADIDGLDISARCIITANVAFGAMLSEEDDAGGGHQEREGLRHSGG